MNGNEPRTSARDLCSLTDSLTSSIRWQYVDYAAFLRAELALLVAAVDRAGVCEPRATHH